MNRPIQRKIAVLVLLSVLGVAACSQSDSGTSSGDTEPSEKQAAALLDEVITACQDGDTAAFRELVTEAALTPELIDDFEGSIGYVAPTARITVLEPQIATDGEMVAIVAEIENLMDARVGDQGTLITFIVKRTVGARVESEGGRWLLIGLPRLADDGGNVMYSGCPGIPPVEPGAFNISTVQRGDFPPPPPSDLEPGEFGRIGTPLMIVAPDEWVRN